MNNSCIQYTFLSSFVSDWSHVTFRVICSKLFLFRDFGFVAVTRVRYSIDDDDIWNFCRGCGVTEALRGCCMWLLGYVEILCI